jgi:TRAP-type C4-dicarboxylate transport system permease small subunit
MDVQHANEPGGSLVGSSDLGDRLSTIISISAGTLLILAAVVVSVGTVLRHAFSYSMAWTVDISNLAILAVTFVGATLVSTQGGHITVDFLITRTKGLTTDVLKVCSQLATIITLVVVGAVCVEQVLDEIGSGRPYLGEGLTFPSAWVSAVLPAGLLLLVAFAVKEIVESIRRVRSRSAFVERDADPLLSATPTEMS